MKGASERGWDSFIQVCQQTNRVIEQFSFKKSMVDKFLDHRFLKTWTDSENWPGEQTVPALLNEIPGEKNGSNPSLLYYLVELIHGAKLASSKLYLENNPDSENAVT